MVGQRGRGQGGVSGILASLIRRAGAWLCVVGLCLGVAAGAARADIAATPDELATAVAFGRESCGEQPAAPPFSFRYAGIAPAFTAWRHTTTTRRLDATRTERTNSWRDPETGLDVRCVAILYDDFPVVEWTVHLEQTGPRDSGLVEDLQALDVAFPAAANGPAVLHGIKGDFCAAASYEPFRLELAPGAPRRFSPPASGKSSDGPDGWPYHNLQVDGGGVIVAVGWPGQWASSFTRGDDGSVRVRAGQERTRFALRPGETARTPLIALLFWEGEDVVRSQNLWRRWYRAHVLPKVDGVPQPAITQIQVSGSDPAEVEPVLAAGIRPDVCWRDAGGTHTWFPSAEGPYGPAGTDERPQLRQMVWLNTGTWEVDRTKYPRGFRPFSDWVRGRGMQFLLWFEPERVGSPASWLATHHPDWLLRGDASTVGDILDLGNPAARAWLVDHLDRLITTEGLDWYREDMNGCGPLPAWRGADAAGREGLTENHHVRGHLEVWDELRRRHPRLRIDSCASGGRRNDLETMRRSVPLLRSDFQIPASQQGVIEGNQCHTHGLSSWLPFHGSACDVNDAYACRSFYLPAFGLGGLTPDNVVIHRQAYAECTAIAEIMVQGDYYPLTPWSLAGDAWIAWQFDWPAQGTGCVQAFRRPDAGATSLTVRLRGLDADRRYRIEDFDAPAGGAAGPGTARTGGDLMATGVTIERPPRGSAVLRYVAL